MPGVCEGFIICLWSGWWKLTDQLAHLLHNLCWFRSILGTPKWASASEIYLSALQKQMVSDSIRPNIYGFLFVFVFEQQQQQQQLKKNRPCCSIGLLWRTTLSLCVGTFPFAPLRLAFSTVTKTPPFGICFAFAILDQDIIFYQWQLFIGPSLFSQRQATSSTTTTVVCFAGCRVVVMVMVALLLLLRRPAINTEFLIYLLLITWNSEGRLIFWHNRYQWSVNLLALNWRTLKEA